MSNSFEEWLGIRCFVATFGLNSRLMLTGQVPAGPKACGFGISEKDSFPIGKEGVWSRRVTVLFGTTSLIGDQRMADLV